MPVNKVRLYGDSDQARGRPQAPGGDVEGQEEGRAARSAAYDPAAVPEWAHESIARTAREHPENLPGHLSHVAEIEAARRYAAGHPQPRPVTPDNARDFLHLAAIEAWQAIASGTPAPALDPAVLYQAMDEAFSADDGTHLADQFYFRWEAIADRYGFLVHDEHGDLLPEVDDEITDLITTAIWFGITAGYLALASSYPISRRLLV